MGHPAQTASDSRVARRSGKRYSLPESFGSEMTLKNWPRASKICSVSLLCLLFIGLGCDSNASTQNNQESATTAPPEPRVIDDNATRGRIHDAFLRNYQPIPYVLDHPPGQDPGRSIQQFLKDSSDTGFTTTSFDQCPSCYSFVIDFELSDLSGRTIHARCAPTIDLGDGAVIEWNAECPRFFRSIRQVRPARVRYTNEFIGLQGEAKKQMDQYMVIAQGTNPPDLPSEWDKVPRVKCQDFTHTCFLITRDTPAGHFEWIYDDSISKLIPHNGPANILALRDRAVTQNPLQH